MTAELYDPYAADVREDPYDIYRELREHHPVYRNDQRRFWALSRFEDVRATLQDWATYTSTEGTFLERPAEGTAFLPMMVTMDPPRHDKLRNLVTRAFTVKLATEMEPGVRRIAAELLDTFAEDGSADLASAFTAPLPTMVIADVLGVPRTDLPQFRKWSDALIQAGNPDDVEGGRAAKEASAALYAYFGAMLDDRRRRPRDDLLTALLDATVDGEHLTQEELLGFSFLLLVAGNETTANLIANGALALAAHPDQRDALIADPSLMIGAVEECLRYDSPIQAMGRVVTRDVVVHGQEIAAGDRLLVVFGAGHRDEREFAEPDRFDVTRRVERQLGFGHGVHFCLGAALARLEARVAFDALLERIPDYAVDGPVGRLRSGVVRGLTSLPVSFTPATTWPPTPSTRSVHA